MNSDGKVGREVENHDWSSGWTAAEFFTANDKTYLWLSKRGGMVHINQINNEGRVGEHIGTHHNMFGLEEVKIFKNGFRNFLFTINDIPLVNKSFVNIFSLNYSNLMSYHTIKNDLKYGDLVLFSGDSAGSGIIQTSTLSKWSHIGIVYKEASNHEDVILLEAVPDNGVSLVNLGEKIKNYSGPVSIRPLYIERTSHMKDQLQNLYNELKGRSYETLPDVNKLQGLYDLVKKDKLGISDLKILMELKQLVLGSELAKAAFDMLDKKSKYDISTLNEKNLEKLFCSELVAEAYQRMGLLSKNDTLHPSNEYIPHDFSSCESLVLLEGELLEEIAIQ